MTHSIAFYAMNGQEFARELRESRQSLLDRLKQQIRRTTPESEYDELGLQLVIDAANNICRGASLRNCGAEYFYALGWLAEIATERVAICSFQGFRDIGYLEEVGIWPCLLCSLPPFSVPACTEPLPQVGFLSVSDAKNCRIACLDHLPPSDDREVNKARLEFQEVLESLMADDLDLLAVLM